MPGTSLHPRILGYYLVGSIVALGCLACGEILLPDDGGLGDAGVHAPGEDSSADASEPDGGGSPADGSVDPTDAAATDSDSDGGNESSDSGVNDAAHPDDSGQPFDAGHALVPVTVVMAGDGSGTVSVGSQVCAGGCTVLVRASVPLNIHPVPTNGSEFGGWLGACRDAASDCTLVPDGPTQIVAHFDGAAATLRILFDGPGRGHVDATSFPNTIHCTEDCSIPVQRGLQSNLMAMEAPGFRWGNWSGACSAISGPSCDLVLTSSGLVRVRFDRVRVVAVHTGGRHACSVLDDGRIRCWGDSIDGQLGLGRTAPVGDSPNSSISSVGDVAVGEDVRSMSLGEGHTCALLTTGAIRCWGYGLALGYGTGSNVGGMTANEIINAGDLQLATTATAVAAGESHSCALVSGGRVRCWGSNERGQLGYGDTISYVGVPGSPGIDGAGDVPVGGVVAQLDAGWIHTCARLDDGAVRCWGAGTNGRLGYGNGLDVGGSISIAQAGNVPVGEPVLKVVAGGAHSCALLAGGRVRCWGRGDSGQLGYNNATSIGDGVGPSIIAAGDVPVGGFVVDIDAGWSHTCAVLDTGAIRCWGTGGFGELGYGDSVTVGDGAGPAIAAQGDVPVGVLCEKVSTGGNFTCALTAEGGVRCWGAGLSGRLGYGSTGNVGTAGGISIQAAGDVPLF